MKLNIRQKRRRQYTTGLSSISILLICINAAHADDQRAAAEFVEQGNRHLNDKDYAKALEAFDQAREKRPDSAEVSYDRGIALYRLGRNKEAEEAFQNALRPDKPDLEAAAKYNLGRCAHASALAEKQDLENAINELSRAVGFYKDALQLRQDDKDAERNLMQAQRLQEYLKKKLELQKQQQPTSQPGDKKEDEKNEEEQQKNDNQQEGENSEQQQGENQQDSENENKESTTQPDPSSQPNEDDGKQDNEQPASQPTSQPQMQPTTQPEDQPASQPNEPLTTQPENETASRPTSEPESNEDIMNRISREEALRLLQEARDAERERREARRKAKLRSSGRIPVDKDW